MVQDGARWCKMVQHGATWCNKVQHGATRCNMVQDSARSVQDGARWLVFKIAGKVIEHPLGYHEALDIKWRRLHEYFFDLLSEWHLSSYILNIFTSRNGYWTSTLILRSARWNKAICFSGNLKSKRPCWQQNTKLIVIKMPPVVVPFIKGIDPLFVIASVSETTSVRRRRLLAILYQQQIMLQNH